MFATYYLLPPKQQKIPLIFPRQIRIANMSPNLTVARLRCVLQSNEMNILQSVARLPEVDELKCVICW